MKNLLKFALVASVAGIMLSACSSPKPKTAPSAKKARPAPAAVQQEEAAAPAAEQPVVNADSLAAEQARQEAERLEAERARLEALINQIMSEDVYFDFDRSELTEKAKELLAQVAELLMKETRFSITIEGHTDARGTEDYNFTLGAKRAMKVKEFLAAYGIEGKRMESVSYGKEAPKAEGESEEAYSQNRRANFRVNVRD
ncbi:MAG: OmpA family protein [Fibrobacter sp.]|nr:OmpA family protein [Fibrobacter sp.]